MINANLFEVIAMRRRLISLWSGCVRRMACAGMLVIVAAPALSAQTLSYTKGQNISPAYEGWEETPDGQRYFLFGYMNRNWVEEIDVAVGPENFFTPGAEDRGQPTHFQPRRNRFTFKVPVPEGFTETDELVWTLTAHGITEKAYASLRPDYYVDNVVIMSETGALGAGTSSPEIRANLNPEIELETARTIHAMVGEPVRLAAHVTDDGVPRARESDRDDEEDEDEEAEAGSAEGEEPEEELTPEQEALRAFLSPPRRVTVGKRTGLHFAWFVYRGDNAVTFDPIQVQTWENTRAAANSPWAPNWTPPAIPEDGRYVVNATFHEPGTYLLRGRADDGGLYSDVEVTVHVME